MRKFLILIIAALTSGCYSPYSFRAKAIENQGNRLLVMMQLTSKYPYLILHDSLDVFQLSEYKMADNNNAITGVINALPANRETFKVVDDTKVNKAQREFHKPFDEMHIGVKNKNWSSGTQVSIFERDIQCVQIYQPVSSGGGKAMIGIGIVLGIAAIIGFTIYFSNIL